MRQGAVVILLDEAERVALQLRDHQEPFPNCWALFGGWLDQGETPAAAATREMQEELSITLSSSQLESLGMFTATIPESYREILGSTILIHVYRARVSASTLTALPNEGAGARWRTAADSADCPMVPYHREILRLFAEWTGA